MSVWTKSELKRAKKEVLVDRCLVLQKATDGFYDEVSQLRNEVRWAKKYKADVEEVINLLREDKAALSEKNNRYLKIIKLLTEDL
jgi:serine/threonine protein phosphatase PrpC